MHDIDGPLHRLVERAGEAEGARLVERDGVGLVPRERVRVEEVLVVEKRLLLREEIRVTRRQSAEKFHEVYTLQSEEVHVERDGDINPL